MAVFKRPSKGIFEKYKGHKCTAKVTLHNGNRITIDNARVLSKGINVAATSRYYNRAKVSELTINLKT